MTFMCTLAGRVLPISIARKLRIDDVQVSPAAEPVWTSVAFIQEKAEEDADAAVVFPAPLKFGAKYLLKTTYHGIGKEVLRDAGDGNYTVGARDSWYPNVGSFQDTADFDLTFRTPQKSKNQIVAVGNEIVEQDRRRPASRGLEEHASASRGRLQLRQLQEDDADRRIERHDRSRSTRIPASRTSSARSIRRWRPAGRPGDFGIRCPAACYVNTERLAQAAFADGANTARTGNLFFGPLPDKRIAITQQSAWFYGQSWPTLVYLPYLAFVGSTTRAMLGFGLDMAQFVDQVGAHEVAHQWWGHQVGWRSYHDAWLSEGFAEFTSGLVLEIRKGFPEALNEFYEKKRRHILEKQRAARSGSRANRKAGPITPGVRVCRHGRTRRRTASSCTTRERTCCTCSACP